MKLRLLRFLRKLGGSLANPRVFYAVAMVLLGAVVAGLLGWWLVARKRTESLVLYSGQPGGIYKPLAEEIAKQIEQGNPRFEIEVRTSDGSRANLRSVIDDRDGKVLAIIQNDTRPETGLPGGADTAVRSLLPLHAGALHFIVREDSPIQSVSGLRGKVIAEGLPGSGTPQIVDALLRHYEIDPGEIERRQLSLADAVVALREGEVDAILLTMGLKSADLESLVAGTRVRFVGIGDGIGPGSEIEGFRLTYPFVQSTLIPKYTYAAPRDGQSGVPRRAVPAISVRAVLIANQSLSGQVANQVTRTLLENRSALSRSHPSAAQITEEFDPGRLQFPIHRGSNRYLHRHDPSYLRQNAEVLGFLLSLMIALYGFLVSLRRWMSQRQKDRIDEYYIRLDELLTGLRGREMELEQLHELDEELWRMNRRAVQQLASEKLIANESFRIFQTSLSEGRSEVRRRIEKLTA